MNYYKNSPLKCQWKFSTNKEKVFHHSGIEEDQRRGQRVCDREQWGTAVPEAGEISRAYVSVIWVKTNLQWEQILRFQELPLALVWRMDRSVGGVVSWMVKTLAPRGAKQLG